jgi:predicted amidophosphoribosyltransferase
VTTPQLQPCLACRERLPQSRGLCPCCLGRARKAIGRGETTWERLQAQGLALPAQPTGRAWRRFTLGGSPGPGGQ